MVKPVYLKNKIIRCLYLLVLISLFFCRINNAVASDSINEQLICNKIKHSKGCNSFSTQLPGIKIFESKAKEFNELNHKIENAISHPMESMLHKKNDYVDLSFGMGTYVISYSINVNGDRSLIFDDRPDFSDFIQKLNDGKFQSIINEGELTIFPQLMVGSYSIGIINYRIFKMKKAFIGNMPILSYQERPEILMSLKLSDDKKRLILRLKINQAFTIFCN